MLYSAVSGLCSLKDRFLWWPNHHHHHLLSVLNHHIDCSDTGNGRLAQKKKKKKKKTRPTGGVRELPTWKRQETRLQQRLQAASHSSPGWFLAGTSAFDSSSGTLCTQHQLSTLSLRISVRSSSQSHVTETIEVARFMMLMVRHANSTPYPPPPLPPKKDMVMNRWSTFWFSMVAEIMFLLASTLGCPWSIRIEFTTTLENSHCCWTVSSCSDRFDCWLVSHNISPWSQRSKVQTVLANVTLHR